MATTTRDTTELDARLEQLFNREVEATPAVHDSFWDRYDVVKAIATGAEGGVFRIREKDGEETYIAKVITRPEDSTEVRNLQNEIRARSRMDDPHIPKVIDCFVEGDDRWKKTEYILLSEDVDGETLEERWQNGPLQQEELQLVKDEVLKALQHSHSKGVLHRDIKPQNILLTPEGDVKLIDWGVAKIQGAQTRMSTLGVVGTAGYMAPEVLNGEGYSEASDLYSLGATLIAAARGEDHGAFDSAAEMKQYLGGLKHLDVGFRRSLEGMIGLEVETKPSAIHSRAGDVVGYQASEIIQIDTWRDAVSRFSGGTLAAGMITIAGSYLYYGADYFKGPATPENVIPFVSCAVIGGLIASFMGKNKNKRNAEEAKEQEHWYSGIHHSGVKRFMQAADEDEWMGEDYKEYILPALVHPNAGVRCVAMDIASERDRGRWELTEVMRMMKKDSSWRVRRKAERYTGNYALALHDGTADWPLPGTLYASEVTHNRNKYLNR